MIEVNQNRGGGGGGGGVLNDRLKKTTSDEAHEHISSNKWISYHGLKKLKLDFSRIMSSAGFKNSEDYVKILKKPVTSRYNKGLFKKVPHKDGSIYNVTVPKNSLTKIEQKLHVAVELYKRRLEWLTTSSRRYFGVIEESNICFIVDIPNETSENFQRYIQLIITMFKEQLIYAKKFNILRAAEDIRKWNESCVSISADSIINAIDWLLDLDKSVDYSITSVLQTLLEASVDTQIDALYLITNGGLCASTKQLIMEKVKTLQIPVHVVYLGSSCSSLDSLYLTELAQSTEGRFHVAPLTGRYEDDLAHDIDEQFEKQPVGVRPDVMLVWEELDDARTILLDLQTVIAGLNKDKNGTTVLPKVDSVKPATTTAIESTNDLYISSKDWLKKFGLKALYLTLQSFLKSSTFDHSCGVLDISQPSTRDGSRKNPRSTPVNAKYCDKFGHITCSDGSVKHVQFSEVMYREYNDKMEHALKNYRKRLNWLQNGSRELFGTIVEEKVCLLIDTSSSMGSRLHIVREKLLKLFQEQLINKEEFNIIHFGSKVEAWKNHLVTCNSKNLHEAWLWVQTLKANGSTNTYTAIKRAYSMEGVDALYFLTDGRPDQPAEMILSQVSPSIPIHPISFNCHDDEANQFLCTLAARTGGRYHQFNDELISETLKSSPYASEDLSLIRDEIATGMEDFERMKELREECHSKQMTSGGKESICKGRYYKNAPPPWSAQTSTYSTRKVNGLGYLDNRTSLLRTNPLGTKNDLSSDNDPSTEEVPVSKQKVKVKKKRKKVISSEIKRWIKKNGLVAQKLTIFDALAPTIVEQKGTFVPSIGKEVLSKVYGDVYPMIRSPGSKEREFKIVNPQAVDMTGYQENLREFLEVVEQKLNSFIFGYLSDVLKEKHRSGVFSYLDNKTELIDDLEEQNLSHIVKDAKLLEKEMRQARLFLKQSDELKELVGQLKNDARAAKKSKEQIVKKPQGKKQSNEGDATNNAPRMRYHRVLARSDIDGFYYPAIVDKYVNPRYVNVVFDTGEKQIVSVRFIISLGGSTACPTLNVGDYVLVKSTCPSEDDMDDGVESNCCYLPGIVQVTPLRMASASKYYTVVRYNGTKLTVLRRDMYKITRSRFVFASRFIQEVHNQREPYNQRESFTAIIQRDKNNNGEPYRQPANGENLPSHLESHSQNNMPSSDENESLDEEEREEVKDEGIPKEDEQDVPMNGDKDLLMKDKPIEAEMESKLEEWKERLEKDYVTKINDIKDQKYNLLELEERLKLNEDKQQQQHILLEKQRQELQLAQEQFLERQLKQQNADQKHLQNEYKDLSERQMEIMKRQEKQQEQLIKSLLEKQEKYDEQQSALMKVMKDEQTTTECFEEESKPSEAVQSESSSNQDGSSENTGEDKPQIKMYVAPDNEAILMSQGDSGIYLSRAPLHEDPAVVVKNLPNHVKVNQEVLARFKDEGWYYRGTISNVLQDNAFVIQDGVGDMEEVCADDILFDEDDANNVIHIGDYVIALHPKYQYAYAPGLVVDIEMDGALRIQFYDGQVAVVPRVECYFIPPLKFENDCNYIRKCEDALIGQAVVCRDNKTGVFHLGAVRDRVSGPRNYLIEWPAHTLDMQNYAFIFGAHTKRQKFEKNCFVLAIANTETYAYLPGRILEVNNDDTLKVEFCDWTKSNEVKGVQSFWLSPDYYANAVKYWQEKNPGFGIHR